jgi:ferredoxin-type protein NapG
MTREERARARRKRRVRRLLEQPGPVARRQFVVQGCAFVAGGVALTAFGVRHRLASSPAFLTAPVRPPSASHDDERFQAACIRCGMCGTVCENGCIRFFPADEAEHGAFTPYLDVRKRSCTLCMRCTQICPSGALQRIEDEPGEIAANVRMGRAVVDPEHCISYLGRVCGYCHDACPIPERAVRLTPPALPVILDGCVGCGRCVELCPQNPTAITVDPALATEPTRGIV